jgi:hypothetical protein
MKKIFIFLGAAFIAISCDDNLSDLNVDPKKPSVVTPEVLFTYGQFNIVKQMVNPDYNDNLDRFWSNYFTQTTYIQEASYDAANRDVGGSLWDNIYTESLYELNDAKRILRATPTIPADEPIRDNKIAMIKVMEVYAYQYLVDSFGPVPFTEAFDPSNVTPKYDEDAFIYGAITDSLRNAIAMFDPSAPGFSASGDILYEGDIEAWLKFANSLLLKIGIRLADVDPATAEDLVNEAVAGGVFESNADNAVYAFSTDQPYINPIYDYFVVDKRASDFVVTQFFIDMLANVSDPRASVYFDENITAGYKGGVYGGIGNAYKNLTHIDPAIVTPDYPGTILDYSFVAFSLAEAVERGFIAGDAAAYYEEGIRASFEAWGLSDVEATLYLAQPSVAYATAGGDFRQKIGVQKYIALFNQGHEAWTEARRLDYPVLLAAASNNTPNPKRLIYPVTEDLINATSNAEAVAKLGGDDTDSPIFWDVD